MTTKRYLVTSALPYINGIKHLGNLIGSLLPADVYSRYLRQRGETVLFICGTDDHGTPAELGAAKEGLPVDEYCTQQFELQKDTYDRLRLSFDHFGRTSRPQNHELTQHFGNLLAERGFVDERTITQIFSPADNRFLPDRYVEGTCPKCGYDKARGDQCEQCTTLLDPTDLINPRSAVSGSTELELRETKHLFLKLAAVADQLRAWVDTKKEWPVLVSSIAYKWLEEGLRERCITRDLKWGVPVGRPGYEDKVYYVWFDAPIGYIAATKEWADLDPANRDWRSWWYDVQDVHYTEFMGKDNVPFHTITFPATLMATGEPWKLVDHLKGFSWLSYYGGKFSTSQHRGVFLGDALDLYPSDYWRYYLLARAPEGSDSNFTWESFQSLANKDLADVLGNLVNRLLRFTEKHFGAAVPLEGSWTETETALAQAFGERVTAYSEALAETEFRKALTELRAIWALGNEYLTEQAPWTTIKADRDRAACVLRVGINLLRAIGVLSMPVIPDASESILAALQWNDTSWCTPDGSKELTKLSGGAPFTVPGILFRKIEDSEVADLEKRFGGPG